MDLAFRELSKAKSRRFNSMSNFGEFIFFFIEAKFSSIAVVTVYNFNLSADRQALRKGKRKSKKPEKLYALSILQIRFFLFEGKKIKIYC